MLRRILAVSSAVWLSAAVAQEEVTFTESSAEFTTAYDEAIKLIRERGLNDKMDAPVFNARTSEELEALAREIAEERPIAEISQGDRAVQYDVILQPGHYGRRTGAVGTQGDRVSERALVAYVTKLIAARLRELDREVLVVSADEFVRDDATTPEWDGLASTTFLAVHADGSVKPCSTGPSLGYSAETSPHAMHAIGFGLASALGYKYQDFRRDNFTANEANYYMFRHVRAGSLEGLLELGELTCTSEEDKLVANADVVAKNVAEAIEFVLALQQAE